MPDPGLQQEERRTPKTIVADFLLGYVSLLSRAPYATGDDRTLYDYRPDAKALLGWLKGKSYKRRPRISPLEKGTDHE